METATLIVIIIAVAIAFVIIFSLFWRAMSKLRANLATEIERGQQELAKLKSELTNELPAIVLEKFSSDDNMRQKIAKDMLLEIVTNSDDLASLQDVLTDDSVVARLRRAVSSRSPQIEIAKGVEALNEKMSDFMQIFQNKESQLDAQEEPTIGIITALPHEYVAVEALLDNVREDSKPGRGAGRRYYLGEVPLKEGGRHYVALALLTDMGNNSAAVRASHLLAHFPRVDSIIMVGIAGGVPFPEKPDDHVRLGDIVVSDRYGVIQYDYIKEEQAAVSHRHPPRPPSATLLEAVQYLETLTLKDQRPWSRFIKQACNKLRVKRPPEKTDILISSTEPKQQIQHPKDLNRRHRQPRVFKGPIASANDLLKNPLKRDQLRDSFGVKAVEMEGSGIADATWQNDTGYLVVRGICDYCDSKKGDDWQRYAAIVAAAYTRALLESIPYLILTDD